jgi:endonuclease/exonuclease/phosphatase family metal-dependent hydrolase
VLSLANFNMHAGIDGWGRPFDFIGVCRSMDVDVLVLEEAWTGQAEEIAGALGAHLFSATLAEGRRIRPQAEATAHWMPRGAFAGRQKSLFFDQLRPIPADDVRSANYREAEVGSWGIALLVRARPGLEVEAARTLHLPTLPRDRVHRVVIVVDVRVDGVPLSVVAVHMSHLEKGSPRHWLHLRGLLRREARPTAVLLGDMNLWGPPVRAFLPGWHRAVKGRTWPTWRPHSQIDHILVRGELGVASGEVCAAAGSDHRPVRAVLTLR